MIRRDVVKILASAVMWGSPGVVLGATSSDAAGAEALRVVMLIHPDMVLLDFVPALTVFTMMMADIQLVWKNKAPVRTEIGIAIEPSATFDDSFRNPDILFVPGGLKGTVAAMNDPMVISYLKTTGAQARYVTSVCTGSLLLAAAGLLDGYKATGHWQSRYALAELGATLSGERVVVDRNRVTGGGVTAGLDFGLTLASIIRGEEWARTIQLILEYAPHPPFSSGRPETAGPIITEKVGALLRPGLVPLDRAVANARRRLAL